MTKGNNDKIVQENGNKLTKNIINLLEGYDLKEIYFAQLKMISLIKRIMPDKTYVDEYLNMIIDYCRELQLDNIEEKDYLKQKYEDNLN